MFTVFAPEYNDKSAGAWMLHFLCDQLNRLGYECSLVIYTPGKAINPNFITPQSFEPENIVIYPEIITNNPLNAKKVVRYLLNTEGLLRNKMIDWGATDFPISYSKVYKDDCDVLFYPICNLELFKSDGRERTEDCFYIGKGIHFAECEKLPCFEVTREYPDTKEGLAEVFKSKRFLFSYDNNSSTLLDAALCGCIPVCLFPQHNVAELGKFWANDYNEVADAKEYLPKLRDVVKEYQNSFQTRLDTLAKNILQHFGGKRNSATLVPHHG
jgi:hypothetical protein